MDVTDKGRACILEGLQRINIHVCCLKSRKIHDCTCLGSLEPAAILFMPCQHNECTEVLGNFSDWFLSLKVATSSIPAFPTQLGEIACVRFNITEEMVLEKLAHLNVSKSYGPIGISKAM